MWLHGLSNGLTAISYFAIPAALLYFVQQRQDLPYRWLFKIFSAFVGVCGLSHVMEIWTLWHPDYWVSGGIKAFNAILALTTATKLIPLIPEALALPSPAQLEIAKANLEDLVRDRTQSLKLSEERWQLALQGTNDGIWDWNFQTGEVFFSDRCKEMLGFDADQFMDSPKVWESLIHPDDLPAVTAAFYEHLEGKALFYTLEHRLQCKDGTYKWVLSRGQALRNEAGTVTRMAGSINDITERKHAEAALNESRRQFRNLVENSPDIIERFDLNLRHLYVSPSLTRITGLSTEVFLGKSCREMGLDETMVNTWEAAVNRLLATGEKQVIEFSTPTLEGVRAFEMVIAPEWDEPQAGESAAKITSLLCISRDITERKQAEEALAASERQLSTLISNLPGYVYRVQNDPNFTPIFISAGVEAVTGYRQEEYLVERSISCGQEIHPDDAEWVWERVQQAVGDRTPYECEYRIRTKTGEERWVWERGRGIYDETGNLQWLEGFVTDISDRKLAEAELLAQKELLQITLDHLPVMISVHSETGNILLVNQTIEQTVGWTQAEHLTRDVLRECYPDPADYDRVTRHIAAADSTWQEFRLRTRDGRLIDTAWTQISLPDGRSIGIGQDITERKQAEAARLQAERLQQELKLLETILDSVLAGYWDCNLREGTNYWSPGLKRMLGYADDEIPNTLDNWEQFILPEDLPKTKACLERHVQSRGVEPYYNEVRYRHKDGSIVWVICTGQAIEWGESGEMLRMVGCHVDITPLKTIEAQLQTSKAHLKEAQRIGNIGSWEFDIQTERITWSDQVFRIFHRDPALGAPKNFAELQQLIHPGDRELHAQAVYTLVDTHQAYDVEFRICRGDGSTGHLQAKGEVVLDATGRLIQLRGIVLDITERKQIEAQNRLLADRLTLALNAGEIGTWDWNMVDEVSWDQRMYEIYGLQQMWESGQTATYQVWRDRLHLDDLAPTEAALQAAIRGEGDYDVEFRIWRTDGQLRWIKANAVVQRDAEGKPFRMTGINYDITIRKQTEAALLRKSAQLEASNQELEAFAYSVSHDLRSPLRAIDGFSRALLEDYGHQFDDEGRDYFNRIRHNVQRMGMLIDDLLSLSRVSRLEMRYATVDLSAIAHELLQELRAAEPERQVECIITPDVIVWADSCLMRVVLSNLLQNAWKFTSHHNTARIEFGILQQPEQTVYFVRDDGAGFDMAYSAMLFGVFQRLHNMTEFPGTGIGLATVQRIIHRHGGQVWAEAAIEQGATIYFTLPIPVLEARLEARSDL
ncbi:PAS domain-containing protein [Thermoleptolyngbya sichuanensis A183]|uniref:histidine kinase n=1 Tax=Thermoleptolyngbya sichuanensis A183 TaxID=2737172 RepID=A0A6M8BNJ7_9CYAN|nr:MULTISPECIES: PAS domain-containing protein [Thermoleptolyngbya]QKD83885.1 PAS domain-containing protein [Thermoleptolyngbya sichuanensis A183]